MSNNTNTIHQPFLLQDKASFPVWALLITHLTKWKGLSWLQYHFIFKYSDIFNIKFTKTGNSIFIICCLMFYNPFKKKKISISIFIHGIYIKKPEWVQQQDLQRCKYSLRLLVIPCLFTQYEKILMVWVRITRCVSRVWYEPKPLIFFRIA